MNDNSVIIAVSEEEIIVSLYNEYLIDHEMSNISEDELKMSIKAFSDYIQQYLIDRYNLDEESVDAPVPYKEKLAWILDDGTNAVCPVCNKMNGARGDFCKWCGTELRGGEE